MNTTRSGEGAVWVLRPALAKEDLAVGGFIHLIRFVALRLRRLPPSR